MLKMIGTATYTQTLRLFSVQPDYLVDQERILGNTFNEKTRERHSRFHLFVRWQEPTTQKKNPFTYRGDHFPNVVEPRDQVCSLLRNFQRHYVKDRWLFAYLQDTLYFQNDIRRNVVSYVNGVVEENRLHNYHMMLGKFPLIDFLKY